MHLEKLLKQHQQIDSTSQKILEVNPDHPLIKDLLKIVNNDNDKQVFDDASWLLLDQARIIEGQPVSDPNKFAKRMNTLLRKFMLAIIKIRSKTNSCFVCFFPGIIINEQ